MLDAETGQASAAPVQEQNTIPAGAETSPSGPPQPAGDAATTGQAAPTPPESAGEATGQAPPAPEHDGPLMTLFDGRPVTVENLGLVLDELNRTGESYQHLRRAYTQETQRRAEMERQLESMRTGQYTAPPAAPAAAPPAPGLEEPDWNALERQWQEEYGDVPKPMLDLLRKQHTALSSTVGRLSQFEQKIQGFDQKTQHEQQQAELAKAIGNTIQEFQIEPDVYSVLNKRPYDRFGDERNNFSPERARAELLSELYRYKNPSGQSADFNARFQAALQAQRMKAKAEAGQIPPTPPSQPSTGAGNGVQPTFTREQHRKWIENQLRNG